MLLRESVSMKSVLPYVEPFFFFDEHQRPSYGHQMNNNSRTKRNHFFLCCQKSLGKRLWCWARLMERLFDFWRDWGQQIEPCELPKWHGHHQRLPATRGHGFSYEPSYCAVGSSRPAPCSQDVGSGLSPGGRKEGEKYRGGWRLCSGMQWTRRFGPSTCHSTALGHCTV